jgi:hypothetical protein
VAWVLAAIVDTPVSLPLARLAILAGLAVAAVAMVTGLTLPAVARAARPETLRVE